MVRPQLGLMLCLLVMFFGCGQLAPAQQDLAKGWAWAGIAASTLENQGKPQPAPAPAPGQVCQTCNGSGKVGDGRVFQICRDCNGTGKVVTHAMYHGDCDGQSCGIVLAQPQQAMIQKSNNEQMICQGSLCYPVTQQKRYQTKQPARVIMQQRGRFFYRR